MTTETDDQSFLCLEASPARMDQLWAEGWRHFGVLFFRYRFAVHGDRTFSVLPLRIDLARFSLTTSQRRVLAKNGAVRTVIRAAIVGGVPIVVEK